MNHPEAIEKMIESFRRLPSVGPKMAERMSYHILKTSAAEVQALIESIKLARELIKQCGSCFNLSEDNPCEICSDDTRDPAELCVVETSQDLLALSKIKNYNGYYFVLGGGLSPLDGVGPGDLRVEELVNRVEKEKIKELIVATNADSKGETTALYIAEQIKPLGVRVTRIGYGIPVGGDLEYADEITLSRAIEGRREM